jgi:hypothetical protein
LQTKRVAKNFFFKFCCIGFSLLLCVLVFTYVYSRYALCLLLQILLVSALDIKRRDAPTVSSINALLSQYCKAPHFFFLQIFMYGGGGGGAAPTFRFAPFVPWAKADPVCYHQSQNFSPKIGKAVNVGEADKGLISYTKAFRIWQNAEAEFRHSSVPAL